MDARFDRASVRPFTLRPFGFAQDRIAEGKPR